MRLALLPEGVGGRVMPPDPVGIERGKPFPKWECQLTVGVAREDEERLEYGLPCCFGLVARGLDVGPAGGLKSVGLAVAVPHFREDVGFCCVTHVRHVCEAHEEPNFIEELAAGWLYLFIHHDFIDGKVEGPAWRDGNRPLSDRLVSESSCQVKAIHPRGARCPHSAKGISQNGFSVPT